MSTKNILEFIPPDLRQFETYPKYAELLQYIVDNFYLEFNDISAKYKDPSSVTPEVVEQVINEFGFKYIYSITEDFNNFDTTVLLNFMSLLHLMKGTRSGLEIVLQLLGFNATIVEWWETDPRGEEHTFDMTINMNLSIVTDVFKTLDKVRVFIENYVYPKFNFATVVFAFELSEAQTAFAGFSTQTYDFGLIQDSI